MGRPDGSRIGADNKSYKMDVVEQAEDLYCVRGRSFESISREMGITHTTLKRWSARYGWQESKRRFRKAAATLGIRTVLALADLVKNACDTGTFDTNAFGKIVAGVGFRRRKKTSHRAVIGG